MDSVHGSCIDKVDQNEGLQLTSIDDSNSYNVEGFLDMDMTNLDFDSFYPRYKKCALRELCADPTHWVFP